ncbi:MAG TPA: hypothetical protein VMI31_01755, partial [Fimbriimonadaceae bacterium]|nr:hypothetical protein [Fimbriimonadaceae bacterium]
MIDSSQVATNYILHCHHCYDEWAEAGHNWVFNPKTFHWAGAVQCQPGDKVTLTETTQSHTQEFAVGTSVESIAPP